MNYRLIFTDVGNAKIKNAELNSDYVHINSFQVGDGVIDTLDPSVTGLLSSRYSGPINHSETEEGITLVDLVIPAEEPSEFTIREVGLFDADGDCIAIGTVPVTQKISAANGATKAVHIRLSLQASNADHITFAYDNTLTYATNVRVDAIELELDKLEHKVDQKIDATQIASTAALGLIKEGGGITINGEGIVNIKDDSHNHTIPNVDGLQTTLNNKLGTTEKAADAHKLDGLSASQFLRSDLHNTSTGNLDITNTNPQLHLGGAAGVASTIRFTEADYLGGGMTYDHEDNLLKIFVHNTLDTHPDNDIDAIVFNRSTGAANLTAGSTVNHSPIVTKAHEGSGKGLDADTVDGKHATDFAPISHDHQGLLYRGDLAVVDLDTITTMGIYHQNANSHADAGTNYPVKTAGMLTVWQDGLMTYQQYWQYNTTTLYIRSKYATESWTPWSKSYNSANKPTPEELGAVPASKVATTTSLGLVKEGGDIAIDDNGLMQVKDDSHNHTIANVDTLQEFLDSKLHKDGKASDTYKLNGSTDSISATASSIVKRDTNGNIHAQSFRSTRGEQTTTPAATADICFRNDAASDNFLRFMTKDAAKNYLGITEYIDTNANFAIGGAQLEDSSHCTAVGALTMNGDCGSHNTAVGHASLRSANAATKGETAIGAGALSNAFYTGSFNTAIGYSAGATLNGGSNNTMLGSSALAPSSIASNTFTLGNGSVNNLRCNDTTISSLSDARDKTDVLPLEAGLDFINTLNPVSFVWDRREWYGEKRENGTFPSNPDGSKKSFTKSDDHPNGGRYFGFLAQEVQSAITTALNHDDRKAFEDTGVVSDAGPETLELGIGYLVTPLVKAVQELNDKLETQHTKTEALQAQVETLQAEIDAYKRDDSTAFNRFVNRIKTRVLTPSSDTPL